MFNPRTHKGLLKPLNNPALFQRVQDVIDASGLFFQNARDDLGFAGSGKIVRILQPEWSQDILSSGGIDRRIEEGGREAGGKRGREG